MKELRQKDGYEFSISNHDGWFHVRRKKINPKTGKGWQAGVCLYAGEDKAIAFRAWLYGEDTRTRRAV